MIPLLEQFQLRWLEEPVIPDDIHGYAALKALGRVPIAGGEHEHTIYGFRQLLEAKAVDYIQFDTNRVGGITQARKVQALAEALQCAGGAARGTDAQLPRRDGEPEFADGGVLPDCGRGDWQRTVLVHLRGRAGAGGRLSSICATTCRGWD